MSKPQVFQEERQLEQKQISLCMQRSKYRWPRDRIAFFFLGRGESRRVEELTGGALLAGGTTAVDRSLSPDRCTIFGKRGGKRWNKITVPDRILADLESQLHHPGKRDRLITPGLEDQFWITARTRVRKQCHPIHMKSFLLYFPPFFWGGAKDLTLVPSLCVLSQNRLHHRIGSAILGRTSPFIIGGGRWG